MSMMIQGHVEVAVGVQFSLLFYDIAGPVVTPDVFLRLDTGYSSTSATGGSSCDGLAEGTQPGLWGALCGGLEVRVGVQLNPWLDWLLPTTNWSLPPFQVKSVLLASSISASPDSSVTLGTDGSFKLNPGESTGISVVVAGSYLPTSLSSTSSWNLSSSSQTCGDLAKTGPGTFVFTAPPNNGEVCKVEFTKNFLGLNVWTSSPLSFRIPAVPPSAPQGLAVARTTNSIVLSWQMPTSNGGSPITGFMIYRGTLSGQESLLVRVGPTTSYDDTSIASGTTYYYKVAAVNDPGTSESSNEATSPVVSQSPPPPPPPGPSSSAILYAIAGLVALIFAVTAGILLRGKQKP
jgi:hypothetical protein